MIDAVFDSLKRIQGDSDQCLGRDARAVDLAPRMAAEGWRFCPCFPMQRTEEHERIFDLVHTNLANRLADRETQAMSIWTAQAGKQTQSESHIARRTRA
jgi:hypothetical protein